MLYKFVRNWQKFRTGSSVREEEEQEVDQSSCTYYIFLIDIEEGFCGCDLKLFK